MTTVKPAAPPLPSFYVPSKPGESTVLTFDEDGNYEETKRTTNFDDYASVGTLIQVVTETKRGIMKEDGTKDKATSIITLKETMMVWEDPKMPYQKVKHLESEELDATWHHEKCGTTGQCCHTKVTKITAAHGRYESIKTVE